MKTSVVVRNLTANFFLRSVAAAAARQPAPSVQVKPRYSDWLLALVGHVNSMRRLGFLLFILSFVMPDIALDGTGIGAFLLAPVAASFALAHALSSASWPAALLGALLALAWLANASIVFNLPRPLGWLAAIVPWSLYLVLLSNPNPVLDLQIASFVPFYFWATGILLIHGSRSLEQYGYEEATSACLNRRSAISRRAA